MSHINSIIVKFSRQIEMSQQEDSHLSLDINHLSVGAKNQDDFMCLTGLSPVLGDPGEVQVVRTVCVEIGTLPYRTTLKETLKLRDSDQFKELRSFSREFLKVNGELDGSNLDKLKDEIVYAKRHLGHAQRAGSIARFFTYIGVPLALATPLVPALGALGVAATLGGAYATAHQHARERRFAWANIGIAST